jgi:EAL domain-containing protein (putative c-di-GMP-specific phosphodiesterase class I)
MREPIELLGHSLVATVSVGSAIYPHDDLEISPLLAKADAAMYEAKAAGRDRCCRYSADTTMYNPARMSLENDLRRAIENNEFVLHFQPQVDLVSQDIRGVEALVRWQHPQRGLVPPGLFIPLAEESGLIVPLGEWVLRNAFRQMCEWRAPGLPALRMSINISALQFRHGHLASFLASQLAACDIDPRHVELELTESVLMHDMDEVLQTLLEIKALGVSLAIDDFGTGFSSLSYLRRFPIDRLKIDQSFVRDIENTPANESIARAIIGLAQGLSLQIIAEGIETPAENAVMKNMRCTEGQGYLFARPLTAEDFVLWSAKHRNGRVIAVEFEHQSGLLRQEQARA